MRPDFGEFTGDLDDNAEPAYDRGRLIAAAAGFFDARGLDADWSSIEDAPDSMLVTSLAMVCPFDLREKQALLECDGPTARAALLIDLLEMSARGMAPDPGAASH